MGLSGSEEWLQGVVVRDEKQEGMVEKGRPRTHTDRQLMVLGLALTG